MEGKQQLAGDAVAPPLLRNMSEAGFAGKKTNWQLANISLTGAGFNYFIQVLGTVTKKMSID